MLGAGACAATSNDLRRAFPFRHRYPGPRPQARQAAGSVEPEGHLLQHLVFDRRRSRSHRRTVRDRMPLRIVAQPRMPHGARSNAFAHRHPAAHAPARRLRTNRSGAARVRSLGSRFGAAAGLNDRVAHTKMTTAARFPVGSVTKPYTAAAVMQLHEQGSTTSPSFSCSVSPRSKEAEPRGSAASPWHRERMTVLLSIANALTDTGTLGAPVRALCLRCSTFLC